jgi:hypothetical protein
MTDFSQAIRINPRRADYYAHRGLGWLLQGKEAEAQSDFSQCLSLNKDLKLSLEQRIKEVKQSLLAKQ